MQVLRDIVLNTWEVLAQMSPYLLLGFIVAGVLSVLISPQWVRRHLGGRGLMPAIKSSIFGVPLPLCSCGVIPVGASLHQHGASRGATAAFLAATPQTGVDSIFATYALLGPVFTIVRPVIALITGILAGGAIDLIERDTRDESSQAAQQKSCDAHSGEEKPDNWRSRLIAAARYGLVTLPGDIAKPLIVGILIAGVLTAVVSEDVLAPWLGGGLVSLLVMLVVGIPIYVCSTGSIPLAVAFMHLGASPGAALVFLIAGPATNAATISVTWNLLGRGTAVIYLSAVVVSALAAGYFMDVFATHTGGIALPPLQHDHASGLYWIGNICAVLLMGMLAWSFFDRRHSATTDAGTDETGTAPESATLNIQGMTCSHCAQSAAEALRQTPGVAQASVDLHAGAATVMGQNMDPDAMVRAVEQLGYRVSGFTTDPKRD